MSPPPLSSNSDTPQNLERAHEPKVKIGCCCLPPKRVELTVNSKKETNGRIKMGQRSNGLLLFTPWKSRTNSEQQEKTNGPRFKMGQESKWAKGQDGLLVFIPWKSRTIKQWTARKKQMAGSKWDKGQMGCCCLPPERVELTVKSKKKQMGQGLKWAKSQNGPRVKMGYCCLPPERVELIVNSKKETNGRVKRGQDSRWAAVVEIDC